MRQRREILENLQTVTTKTFRKDARINLWILAPQIVKQTTKGKRHHLESLRFHLSCPIEMSFEAEIA